MPHWACAATAHMAFPTIHRLSACPGRAAQAHRRASWKWRLRRGHPQWTGPEYLHGPYASLGRHQRLTHGDIDPGVLLFILRRIARSTTNAAEAADLLEAVVSKKAGLLGVSEISSDMRDLRNAISKGNAKAQLAVEMFTKSVAKWIAGYAAELGGMDMLVFTGGIGENDFATRTEVCARLPRCIILDASRNNVQCAAVISADHSPVMVRVIPPPRIS